MARRFSAVLVALLVVLAAASAAAEPAATSRLTWVTNGTVRAVAVHDQTLYIGGSFTRVAPAANFLGPWFGVSTTTGAALPRLPLADGPVLAIEPDGAGGYYVGGRFTPSSPPRGDRCTWPASSSARADSPEARWPRSTSPALSRPGRRRHTRPALRRCT
jgi:hypothetical protein